MPRARDHHHRGLIIAPPSATSSGYSGVLRAGAHRWPDRTALVFEDRQWTYAELDAWVDVAARELRGRNVSGRVLLLAQNCPEYLVAQFALSRIGATFATPNASWTSYELAAAVMPLQATTVVGDPAFHLLAPDFVDIASLQATPRSATPDDDAPVDLTREAYLPFSSGTTGSPKAVRHTEGSLCGAVDQLVHHLALTPDDHVQMSLPLCHIFGATMSAAALAAGARITLFHRFSLDEAYAHARDAGVTVLPIAGTTAYKLAQRTDLAPLPALRFFLWGGGPVPRAAAEVITAQTGVGFLASYGMTEAMISAFNPVATPSQWRLDSPGYPTTGTELRLAESGEIEVRGPSVASGYVGTDEGWTADGWFRTGDLGTFEPDGRLLVVDRLKDMLKVSGFAVAPTEVELAVLELDGVVECGVFGEPDEVTGERPVALVVGDVTTDELDDWVTRRLSRYKRPRRFELVDTLPRTAGGKLRRRDLPGWTS